MIRTSYDPEVDILAIRFAPPGHYVESEEVAPGVVLDFDKDGRVIGIEVQDVRERMAERTTSAEGETEAA